jgi:hypothetical protein
MAAPYTPRTYRGMDGLVSLGGYVSGAPTLQAAVAEGATSMTLTGTPLTGVLMAGDTCTVPGVSGTFTVTGTVVASGNTLASVPFTPAAPAGGFPAGGLVFVTTASVAQTRQWSAAPTIQVLETTVQGEAYRTRRTGLVEWEGSFEALFDYGDPGQKRLMDRYTQAKPDGTVVGLSFVVSPEGPVMLGGSAVLTTLAITSPGEDLVTVTASFQSTSLLLVTRVAAPPDGGDGGGGSPGWVFDYREEWGLP